MTDVQAPTWITTGGRFERRTESGVGTDVPVVLQALSKRHMSDIALFSPDDITNLQRWAMYDQDDQTSTRDVGVDAARQTYRTRNIPSTVFMGAVVDLTYGMAARQLHRDIDAIAHMDDKEVINELAAKGLTGVAKRLRYLYDVTEEDEEDVKLDSLRGFATLVIKNRDMYLPQITVTDDGLIQAVWKHPRQGTLVMDFQESGDVEFTLLYGRWDQGTKRRKLSGELHPDHAMLHVSHFVRKIMWT